MNTNALPVRALGVCALVIIIGISANSTAQEMPPRVIGSLQIDEATKAPLQVVRSVNLDAPPEAVFQYVTDHSNWPKFFGPIQAVRVKGNGKKGSDRTFTFADGGTASERIVAFDEPAAGGSGLFAYSLSEGNPFGLGGHLAVIQVTPADGGGAVLRYFQHFSHPKLEKIAPVIAGGTDEILSHILYRFGGGLRGQTDGASTVRITQQRVVDATVARTWTVLGDQWGEVDRWASVIAHSKATGGSDSSLEGATRSCEVPGTPGFRERMIAYDESDFTLTYQVLEGVPPFVTRATNQWTLEELGPQRVLVTSQVELRVAPGTPAPAVGFVKGQFTAVLDVSLDDFAHYVGTGKPHPRKAAAR